MTGGILTPEQLHYVPDGELLALMAGTFALRVRTLEDCELLDAIGREFRERKSPDWDMWTACSACGLPAIMHDPVDLSCSDDDANAIDALGPDEWERVRPFIFGMDAAA